MRTLDHTNDVGVISSIEVTSNNKKSKKVKKNKQETEAPLNDDDDDVGKEAGSQDEFEEEDEIVVIRTTEKKIKEYEHKISREIHNLNTIPPSLGYFSIVAGLLQFIQSIFLFIFAAKNQSTWYLYTNFSGPEDRIPQPTEVAAFSILWYGPIFTVLSGLDHFCCIFFRTTYKYYLERCQNPYRWIEYTISASIMRILMAQAVGVTDIHLLICMFVLSVATIQTGLLHETFNAKARADGFPQQWGLVYLSCVCHFTTYGIIFDYFNSFVKLSKFKDDTALLWPIVVVMFLCEASFAILFVLQWAKWEPLGPDYIDGEKAFIVLSFLTKTMLAWLAVKAFL